MKPSFKDGSLILLFIVIIFPEALSQTFSSANIGALPKYWESRALWADVDNDGDVDLVFSHDSQTRVGIYLNSGGTLAFHSSANLPALLHPMFGVGDFDKDGYIDLVLTGVIEGGDTSPVMGGGIYLNDGTGLFSMSTASLVALARGSVDCADFDLDGDTDILMTGYDKTQKARTVIMMNNNDGSFSELSHQLPGVASTYGSNGAWGDYDRDGDPDILLSGETNGTNYPTGLTKIFVNNGDRTFSEATISLKQFNGKSEWVDVNDDGALDVFVSGYISGSQSYSQLYLNQSPTFIQGPGVAATDAFFAFHWVDFDNDGDKDLLTSEGREGVISLYINDEGTSFTKLESFSVPNHTEVSVADFNSDGHYDIFLSGYTNGFAASNLALINNSSTPNVAPDPPASLSVNISGPEVLFTWDAATDTETSGSSLEYVLRVGTSPGSSDVVSPLTTAAGHNLAFEFMDGYQTTNRKVYELPDGTYFASVQSIDQTGKASVPSNEVTFTVADGSAIPRQPNNLRLSITTTNFCELKWLDQSNNENTFDIERSDDGVSFHLLTTVPKNTMSYVDKTVELDREYSYRIKAMNAQGSSNYTTVESIFNPKGIFRKLDGFELSSTEAAPSISVNWVDYDSDGFDDLFMATSQGPNFLYRNQQDGSFQKIIGGDLIAGNVQNRRSCWADYDNDGDMDVFVPTSSRGRLFRNDSGTFSEVTESPFNENTTDTYGVSWVDYDNDGFLDLSVLYYQSPSALFHNNGDGSFSKDTGGVFTQDVGNFAAIAWCDYNNDGWQDALALNYGGELLLYKNTKGVLKRVIDPVTSAGSASVSASWGDYDNDGDFDVFVGNNVNVSDSFFENNGNGSFTKKFNSVTEAFIQSNGSAWGDIDNDGNLDLFLTGNTERTLFLNIGDGSFERQATEPATTGTTDTEAVALGDYDQDGFLDAAFPSYWESPSLLKNHGNSNHWVSFHLEGTATNRNAIGAKVTITSGGKERTNYIASQTGHSSQNSFNVHFGLGSSSTIDSVVVSWPLRGFQAFSDVEADQFLTIIEPTFPLAPTLKDVVYSSTTQRVSVGWDLIPGATKYVVERSIGNEEGFQVTTEINAPISVFGEEMPVELDSVFYRVLAIEGNNGSWYSKVESVFCGLRAPENLETAIVDSGVRLNWSDLSAREIHYELFRSENGTDFAKVATVADNVIEYNDPSAIEEQTTYHYALQAVSGQVRSRHSDTTSVSTLLKAPSNLTIEMDQSFLILRWTDNSQKETSYVIERSYGNNQQFEVVGTVGPNSLEFIDENFTLDEQIFYRVKAGNAHGESNYSAEANMLVSAAEDAIARLVQIYPNPANSVVNVKTPPGEKMFFLTNMVGVEVMRQTSAREITQLDMRNVPAGVYFLSTIVSGRVVMKKVSVSAR